ncbi:hypothetical protein J4442_04720 [Candidatus Woesearchaeota archaeon]|nr:hypothetical protein [Candidatus Woesearchaeota archaeon]
MKHTFKITIILTILFLLTQLIGLGIISKYVDIQEVVKQVEIEVDGETITQEIIVKVEDWDNLPYDLERPKIESNTSYIAIGFSILLATLLALLLIKLEARVLWKAWFFLSVWFTLSIALNAFILQSVAVLLGLALAYLKAFKPNVIMHNLTELFIYGGLAVIFVPILNLTSIFVLLILISIYDMYAVWKSKHMIKMAEFQTKLKLFAGLLIPYGKNKTAILGGGDLGFPLLFTGVMYKSIGLESLLIILTTTISLFILLYKSEKNKYYPAMPFISIGCLLGYLLTLL